jgi:drug/metabolite transporter (DMT)-like permease
VASTDDWPDTILRAVSLYRARNRYAIRLGKNLNDYKTGKLIRRPQRACFPVVPLVVLTLIYVGLLGGPVAIWAATSVSRALPTLVSSLGFLGVPVLGVIVSTQWLGESLTSPLVVGAMLVLLGLVIVALGIDRQRRRKAS